MAYNGSVEVISGLKQKNNADFPIVDASAVYVADGKRLSGVISGLEDKNIKTYIDGIQAGQSTELNAYNSRLGTIENHIGTYSNQSSISQRLNTLETEIGPNGSVETKINGAINVEKTRATNAENALGNRATTLEGYVGGKNVSTTVEGYITTNIATTGNKVPTAATVKAVTDALGNRTSALETNVGLNSKTVDVRISEAVNAEKTRATGVEDGHNTRISTLENVIGSTDVMSDEIAEMVNDEIIRASKKESELECRVDDINEGLLKHVKLVDHDGKELSIVKDSNGNVLAYFDEYGNFHITGNLYCANW